MAEFKLGRIRFVWKGNWTTTTTYYQDDVVALGGKIYICVIGHESQADFFSDFDIVPPKWNLVSDGQTWKGAWNSGEDYIYSDIVSYGSRLYICNTIHTSALDSADGLEADEEKWDVFAEGLAWQGNWAPDAKYLVNDMVKYGGSTYICTVAHTSTNSVFGLETDSANWEAVHQGFEFKSNWSASTRYKLNDVVRYGASLWVATLPHTSDSESFQNDSPRWEKFVEGFQYEGEWDFNIEYQQGDIVQYGGYQYIAKTNNSEKNPYTSTDDWDLFSEGIKFLGDWNEDSTNYEYKVGELVRYGGFTYICIEDHQNQEPPNPTYWKKFNSGLEWRGEWLDDNQYYEGDVVRYGDNSYVCINSHISEGDDYSSNSSGAQGSRPDLADSGQYWSIIAVGSEQSVLTAKGDLVYYSGSAPTRLPIGQDGQVLTVNADGIPNWEFLGSSEDVYFVAEHGVDSPAPIYGKSIDRPWASIRYAAQQVERGTKFPQAKKLLELNRRFIQREIIEWTDYQIANATGGSMWENLVYESSFCERDMGLIVDALVWDITHGGNVRSREAALSYVNDATEVYTKGQEAQTVASIEYGLTVIQAVLNQEAPAANYQALNGDNSTAIVDQYTSDVLVAEPGVIDRITNLTGIITDAVTAGNDLDIPDRLITTNLIKVSTGKYYEVLPIIVPAETAILGDELRSTQVQPRKASNSNLTPRKDVKFSFSAAERMEEIVGDIVTGIAVSPTDGNTVLQDQTWPFAETTVVGPATQKLARVIRKSIDQRVGDKIEAVYLPKYESDTLDNCAGRDLLLQNKDFLKAEIEAYLDDQYPTLYYSRTKCKQDVGFIIDAVCYDLTYGGNWQSYNAGAAYYAGTTQIAPDSSEQAATIAAYGYLKSLLQTVARNIAVDPVYQIERITGNVDTVPVPQIAGNGCDTAGATIIGNVMDDLIEIVTNGPSGVTIQYPSIDTSSDTYTVQQAVSAQLDTIKIDTIDFINKNFGSFRYDSSVCRRDLNYILTDVVYDIALGTNYNAVYSGIAYNRPINSYNLANEKIQTIGALRFARDSLQDEITDATAETRSNTAINTIVSAIDVGPESLPTLSYPVPAALPTANADDAFNNIEANKTFIEEEIAAWIDDQILENNVTNPNPLSIWFGFEYNSTKCKRDVGYIVEAMKYDILYGGTMATTRIAQSYFGLGGTAYPADQAAQTASAYDRLSTVLDQIAREATVTTSSGNAETQTKLGSAATSTEGSALQSNMQIIEDVLTAGNLDNLPAVTYPDLSALSVSATLQTEKTAVDTAKDQIILDTVQYISDTYNDFNYDHAKCSRDIGLIVDAAIYDYHLDTNFASIIAGYSYLRAPSNKVVGDQKAATLAANEFAKQQIIPVIESAGAHPKAVSGIRKTWEWIDDIIFLGSTEGSNKAVNDQEVFNAVRMLELNREFITSEVHAYIDKWFSAAVSRSNSATGELTVSDTSWMTENMAIRFEDPEDSSAVVQQAGLDPNTTYYVTEITSSTTFTIGLNPGGGSTQSLIEETSGFVYDHEKCRRDTGLIIDAVSYDTVLNTNYNQITAGLAYARANASKVALLGMDGQLTETVDGINYAKSLVAAIPSVSVNSTALSRSNAAFNEIIDILENGSGNADAITWNVPSIATTGQSNTVDQLQANKTFLQAEVIAWIAANYPALSYDQAKCERDVGYIVDALTYDILYGGNSATIQAAKAYFVGAANQLGAGESTATELAYNYLQSIIGYIILEQTSPGSWTQLSGGSQDTSNGPGTSTEVAKAETLIGIIEQVIADDDLTSLPVTTYPDVSFADANIRESQIGMIDNKDKIILKTIRYLDDTYSTLFRVRADYNYNMDLCTRDVNEFIDAIQWDLQWPQDWKREYTNDVTLYRPGCYKTLYAARYYANAVIGSQEEDFYYMRNGTGLRMMTLDGLQGDLGPANEYGTRRPTAGAYASLDPGWGPDDERVWITSRSPYLQNNTCFGYAATGQRIDGALHNGGNDSIVSNDFTQVISDGIGAHILNNGRAELVSVFTYYSHVGYLAETGGRIRATNGNNSYGTFGSVAEGTDADEIPVTGVVDNRTQYNATIAIVNTDNDQLLNMEFSHAGNDYTEAEVEIFGPGSNEVVIADEFRDNAVSQVRITEDLGNNLVAGGSGYLIVGNTAQTGDATSITLSATDGNLSTAYPGMRIQITGGAGIGCYGIIDSYNAGTKVADVIRESDGQPGWDHVVPGWNFTVPNSTSTYDIEPYIGFSAPTYSNAAITLPTATTWNAVKWIDTSDIYTAVSASSESDGTGATFDITRNSSKYYLEINSGGTGYQRLDTLSIHGDSVGGSVGPHDITITVTTVDANGAIVDFDFTGYASNGTFLATGTGANGALSKDGTTWSAETLPTPSAGNWTSIASGLQDDGSSTYKATAVVLAGNGNPDFAISGDATTWSTVASPAAFDTTGTVNVAFGQVAAATARFIAISSTDVDVIYSDNGGASWTTTTSAIGATGFDSLVYGAGKFVAINSGTTSCAWSADGIAWNAVTLPGVAAGTNDLVWGNGRFVTFGGATGIMYSFDGETWYENALSLPLTVTERRLSYGQGMFIITSDDTNEIMYSQDGLYWQSYTLATTITGGYNAAAFGNPDRVGSFVILPNASGTGGNQAKIGATTRARVAVANEQVFEVRMYEPGSGYTSAPTATVVDPNNIEDVILVVRTGSGCLANPTFADRGQNFTAASADINEANSNGYADFFQDGNYIAVKRLTERPVPGSNVVFDSLPGEYYKLVNTVSFLGSNDGSYTAFLQVSPTMSITKAPTDGDPVTMRIRFSQVRLTGHDFLDIGTGNFEDTNYPGTPVNTPDQEAETTNSAGGRVFYTATDQDGNFRVGGLFSIEQSTGVATLNAEAFNIAGLQELTLGTVTLGGNSASVTEFSTDPFFTANSDTVVPTQRAVKAYIEAQIGGGGASLVVNSVTAGDVFVGSNVIATVTGEPINIKANVVFSGTVLGYPLAYQYFLR
jgi:hypothetical protein